MVRDYREKRGLIVGNYCHDVLIRDGVVVAETLGGAASFISAILDGMSVSYELVSKVGQDFAYSVNNSPIVVPSCKTTVFHAHFGSKVDEIGHQDRVLKRVCACDPIRPGDLPDRRFDFGMAVGVGGEILPETLERMVELCSVVFVDIQALVRDFDIGDGTVKLVGLKESGFYHLLDRIGFIKASADEALFMDVDEVREWCCVVVTSGKEGCKVCWKDEEWEIKPFLANQIDPTGAGDSFLGGLTTGLVQGLAVPDAALLGNLFGSLAVGYIGLPKFESELLQVHQDMTAPLSHYYIYTGHNSYLTGNQISSACSDVPIIKALQRGVRGVELDLWPNSTKDDVLVLHGRTLTTPVKLIRCLKSIKEYAFSTSPYPVIITLEDHLPSHLQSRVAEMITQTFGEMLWYPETEFLKEFPSPEELKYRIIISTKLPKEYLQSKILNTIANESQKEKDSENDEWGNEPTELIANKDNDNKSNSGCGDQSPDDEVNDDSSSESGPPESPEYKLLIAIEVKKRKGGLKKALKLDIDKVRRLSLREQALKKAAESYSADVVRFTQKNFLRIFPKATRVTSSNYRPLIGWRLGAQMVALNMQGYGRPLWLMHGMFRANGGCGYVKKPNFLMNIGPHGDVFDPNAIYPVKTTLKVKVYMGDGWHLDFKQTHFNLYSPPDFYTRVGIAGVPADETMKKTKIRKDNWTPVWNEEFTFPLTVPELALLRIEVHEYNMPGKDDFGGQTCLPVSELKQGIRAVPLFDSKGVEYSSPRLLTHFEFV